MLNKLTGIQERYNEINQELMEVGDDYQRATELAKERSDLEPLIQDVRSHIAPEREAEGETFDKQPAYLDALKFWASPAAMHLREHMGMLPSR